MNPKINVLVKENGKVKAVTRYMTDDEYFEFIRNQEIENNDN